MSNQSPYPVRIAPSILSADFAKLGAEVTAIDEAGADYIHIDVMDGAFVPNITFGPPVINCIRAASKKIFDVHLMVDAPERYITDFVKAGADIVTVHAEATTHLHRTLQAIKAQGVKAGVALNPATPVEVIRDVMPLVDMVLVMTVNPGFGGQSFIPLLDKISAVRTMIDKEGRQIDLEVDGGITPETAREVIKAGADVLVAGTAIFKAPQGYQAAIQAIRGARG